MAHLVAHILHYHINCIRLKNLFPDCEVGAMSLFGNIYDMPVYAASAFAEDEEIVFNASTHTDAIRMSYNDYIRLVDPNVVNFSEPVN